MFISGAFTSRGYRYSDDEGRTWKEVLFSVSDSFAKGSYTSGAFDVYDNDKNKIIYASDDGILSSDDNGNTWSEHSGGFSGHCVRNFSFTDDGRMYGAMHDFADFNTNERFVADSNGDYPTSVSMHDAVSLGNETVPRWSGSQTCGDVDVDPDNPNHIIASIGKYGDMIIEESSDGGQTWVQHLDTVPSVRSRVNEVKFSRSNSSVVYTSFFITRDGGETWQNTPCMIMDVKSGENDYVAGYKDGKVYLSDDVAYTWRTIDVPYEPWNMKFDTNDSTSIWLACGTGNIVKITGENVTVLGKQNGLGGERLYQVAQNPFDSNHLIACGTPIYPVEGKGLYESLDGGENWHIVPGIPGAKGLYSVEFNPNERSAVVGSYMGTFIYNYDEFKKYLDTQNTIVRKSEISIDGIGNHAAAAIYTGAKYNTVKGTRVEEYYTPDKKTAWGSIDSVPLGTIYSQEGELLRDVKAILCMDFSSIDTSYIRSVRLELPTVFWSTDSVLNINHYSGEKLSESCAAYSDISADACGISDFGGISVNRTEATYHNGDNRDFSIDVTNLLDRRNKRIDLIFSAEKKTSSVPYLHDGGFIRMRGGKDSDKAPKIIVEYAVPTPHIEALESDSGLSVNFTAYSADNENSVCVIVACYSDDGNVFDVHAKYISATDSFGRCEDTITIEHSPDGKSEVLYIISSIESIKPMYKKNIIRQ